MAPRTRKNNDGYIYATFTVRYDVSLGTDRTGHGGCSTMEEALSHDVTECCSPGFSQAEIAEWGDVLNLTFSLIPPDTISPESDP